MDGAVSDVKVFNNEFPVFPVFGLRCRLHLRLAGRTVGVDVPLEGVDVAPLKTQLVRYLRRQDDDFFDHDGIARNRPYIESETDLPKRKAVGDLKPLGLPTLKPRKAPAPDATDTAALSSRTWVCVTSEPYFSTAALMSESKEE